MFGFDTLRRATVNISEKNVSRKINALESVVKFQINIEVLWLFCCWCSSFVLINIHEFLHLHTGTSRHHEKLPYTRWWSAKLRRARAESSHFLRGIYAVHANKYISIVYWLTGIFLSFILFVTIRFGEGRELPVGNLVSGFQIRWWRS